MNEPVITSRQNPRVKEAVRLREGRERRQSGRHLIDGEREIRRAVEAGVRPLMAFVCETGSGGSEKRLLEPLLAEKGAEILSVTAEVFEKLCFGEREQTGVVVVAETPRRGLSELERKLPPQPLLAVIEGVEKPGNVGAILRSADAAGVDGVIVADGATDLFNPNTIRASLGTVFKTNVVEATAAETIAWLRVRGLRVVAARPEATVEYTSADLRGGVAMVLGSEAEGLTDAWRSVGAEAVRLPMRGIADSLNVSTTAAVLFYEAVRQRVKSREHGAGGRE
ncbi:MAG: TrmH family RNA methyltransferase [Pirellulales bacterium]